MSITNSQDSVIEGGSAGSAGDDTTNVLMEHGLVGFNCNGDWSFSDGGLELGGALGSDAVVLRDGDETPFPLVLASKQLGRGNVRILDLGLEWVILGVHEGEGH